MRRVHAEWKDNYRVEVPIRRFHNFRTHRVFESNVQNEENRNVDVCMDSESVYRQNPQRELKQPTSSEKTRNIEFSKENSQAIDEDEDGRPCTTPIRQVRLPRVVVGILPEIESLFFHSSI